jgi:nucleoside-diphosphate-sugar epimerase
VIDLRVGLLGATSLVGSCLIPLLLESNIRVCAFSRNPPEPAIDGVVWRNLSASSVFGQDRIEHWLCVAPIWVLPDYFSLLEASGVRRIVVLSSTSRFTKQGSSDLEEQNVARRLREAEACVQAWAKACSVEWVILRPTLIYGCGEDRNITEIAHFIRRFGFFPLLGRAKGLRQPVHAKDVAGACLAALQASGVVNSAYNISGGETLPYRDMVGRIFVALGRPCRLLSVPLWAFRAAVTLLRCLPRYRDWSVAMAQRMDRDLVFDHSNAKNDFGFSPRLFQLVREDLPI